MKLLFAAMCLVSALGLSKLDSAPPSPAPALASETSAEEVVSPGAGAAALALCPRAWRCGLRWFGTEASCVANCTVPCELDYRCSGGCVCP
jgi:hypothetical protein